MKTIKYYEVGTVWGYVGPVTVMLAVSSFLETDLHFPWHCPQHAFEIEILKWFGENYGGVMAGLSKAHSSSWLCQGDSDCLLDQQTSEELLSSVLDDKAVSPKVVVYPGATATPFTFLKCPKLDGRVSCLPKLSADFFSPTSLYLVDTFLKSGF